jgi:uncharacterized protein YbjQ (UPF0145 family)
MAQVNSNPGSLTWLSAIAALLLAAFLAGCADGSALVIGEVRPAIEDWTTVTILTEMPDGAEQIAIVKASSDAGFSQQQSLDYAVDALKQQAAKVGANAIIIGSRSTETSFISMGSSGGVAPVEMEIVEGIAIYIDE